MNSAFASISFVIFTKLLLQFKNLFIFMGLLIELFRYEITSLVSEMVCDLSKDILIVSKILSSLSRLLLGIEELIDQ